MLISKTSVKIYIFFIDFRIKTKPFQHILPFYFKGINSVQTQTAEKLQVIKRYLEWSVKFCGIGDFSLNNVLWLG